MSRSKKIMALFLSIVMVLGLLPASAFAANDTSAFSDVKTSAWYHEDVQYVSENGLMKGTGENLFSPDATTTRGMIVTILYRLEGEPSPTGACPFQDVASGKYYEKAITWAAENGIVSGFSADTFGPDQNITREQMAAILYRYATYKKYDVSTAGDLSKFPDADKVSSYAVDAMKWANAAGLINGSNDGKLYPAGNATRAQVAAILTRFCKNIAAQCTVTFQLNYGSEDTYTTLKVAKGDTITAPKAPTRSGYTFSSWSEKTSGSAFDFKTPIEKDITLYAQWNKKSSSGGSSSTVHYYTVTFDARASDATNVPEAQQIRSGNVATEPTTPSRSGYTFNGWYTDNAYTVEYNFTEAVNSNITLYAKWTAIVTEPVNGFTLRANKKTVFIGEEDTTVHLYVETDATVDSINLKYGEKNALNNTVNLFDNGQDADDIAGDGIYSVTITPDVTEDTELSFVAEIGNVTSNIVNVAYYTPISAATYDAMNIVDNGITNLLDKSDFKNKTDEQKIAAIRDLLDGFVENEQVQADSVFIDEENKLVSFQYPEGILGGVMYGEFEPDKNGVSNSRIENNTARFDVDDMRNHDNTEDSDSCNLYDSFSNSAKAVNGDYTAIILNSFPSFETENKEIEYRTDFYENLKAKWDKNGLETTLIVNPSVNDYKMLSSYNIICISTHGIMYSWKEGNLKNSSSVIVLGEEYSTALNKEYHDELNSRQLVKINGHYCILPNFFEEQYNDKPLAKSFIFSECCTTMGEGNGSDTSKYNYSMANAFINCSAKAFIGFHNSVFADYSREFMEEYVDSLVAGKTSQESFNNSVHKLGANHEIWFNNTHDYTLKYWKEEHPDNKYREVYKPLYHIAYPVHNGNGSEILVASGVKNGGFENESFSYASVKPSFWDCLGDVRTLAKLGYVSPCGNWSKRMAIITTGIGSQKNTSFGDGTEGSMLSQTFKVPEGKSRITFNYNFISEEPMEYVGSQYDDSFVVQASCGNGIFYNNTYESINTSSWKAVKGINFVGGDDTAFQTGWKTGELDVSAYVGKIITLSFIVYDVGDQVYDSACIIDNVMVQ